jgi:hypothetical protein
MKNITLPSTWNHGMPRLRQFISLMLVISSQPAGYSQQSEIEVGSIEYVWEKDRSAATDGANPHAILLSDALYQSQFKENVTKAMQDKWPGTATNFSITYRQLPGLGVAPKFETKLKNKAPDKNYIFLQLFDKTVYSKMSYDTVVSALFRVNYKLVDGRNGASLSSKGFNVRLLRQPVAAGQVQLYKLAANPGDLLNALDSIIKRCLNDNTVTPVDLTVQPAVVYDTSTQSSPTKKLNFFSVDDIIQLRDDQSFAIRKMEVISRPTRKKKNVGGNLLGGALTVLTGVTSEKKKYYEYLDDHAFSDGKQLFHCLIGYTQFESTETIRVKNEDGNYELVHGEQYSGRFIDPKKDNNIIVIGDTVCTFKMHSNNRTYFYSKMWNGSDTSTVASLPFIWNNGAVKEWEMNGTMLGTSFTLESLNDGSPTILFIDGQLAALLYSTKLPVYATLYMNLNQQQLKLLTILSFVATNYHDYN